MYSAVARTALVITTPASLTACGPETNSRYGDKYWAPRTTKETFDPGGAKILG